MINCAVFTRVYVSKHFADKFSYGGIDIQKTRGSEADCTYSRGFFFGPGLPRGLGVPSSLSCAVLLDPGFGPKGPPFLFGLTGGSATGVSDDGTGVLSSSFVAATALMSIASFELVSANGVVAATGDDEEDLTLAVLEAALGGANGRRRLGEILSTILIDFLPFDGFCSGVEGAFDE